MNRPGHDGSVDPSARWNHLRLKVSLTLTDGAEGWASPPRLFSTEVGEIDEAKRREPSPDRLHTLEFWSELIIPEENKLWGEYQRDFQGSGRQTNGVGYWSRFARRSVVSRRQSRGEARLR